MQPRGDFKRSIPDARMSLAKFRGVRQVYVHKAETTPGKTVNAHARNYYRFAYKIFIRIVSVTLTYDKARSTTLGTAATDAILNVRLMARILSVSQTRKYATARRRKVFSASCTMLWVCTTKNNWHPKNIIHHHTFHVLLQCTRMHAFCGTGWFKPSLQKQICKTDKIIFVIYMRFITGTNLFLLTLQSLSDNIANFC